MSCTKRSKAILMLYQIKEKLIKNPTMSVLEDMSLYLEDNFKSLEACYMISTRASIEIILNHRTSYPAFLNQDKLVYIYHIFMTMLGIIDGRYDDYNRDVDYANKRGDVNSIQNIEKRKNQLEVYRRDILYNYIQLTEYSELNNLQKNFFENINMDVIPFYKNFNNLCENMQSNHYQLSLQGEIISSYMNGYNKSLYFLPNEIMKVYESLFSKFNNKMIKHKKHEDMVKKLK